MLVEIKTVNKEEVTVVTSLDISETFGKEHFHVLRDIENLECSKEFRESCIFRPVHTACTVF